MLLFIPGPERAQIVITRRSIAVGSHRGQMSFAGGRSDASDPSPWATATRELYEELGVAPGSVEPLGSLAVIPALDGAAVHPVVGAAAIKLSDLKPAAAEVAGVFALDWTTFRPEAAEVFSFNVFGHWRQSRAFATASGTVWGLTAHILFAAGLGS